MNTKRAFTLVELLVVIAIIGMLAALITSAGSAAINSAKQARIKMVMGQVELALEQYKAKYGEYPPDWSDEKAVLRHVKKRWPRIDFAFGDTSGSVYPAATTETQQYDNFVTRIRQSAGWDAAGGNPHTPRNIAFAGTIPFWLGGLPDNSQGEYGNTATKIGDINNKTFNYLIGFSTNPEDPFDVGTIAARKPLEKPIMEFTTGKNMAIFLFDPSTDGINGSGAIPVAWSDTGPIVYFKADAGQPGDWAAYRVPANPDGTWNANNNTSFYTNLHNSTENNTPVARIKSLWTPDQYGNTRDVRGYGYRFGTNFNKWDYFYPGVASPYLQNRNNGNVGGEGGANDGSNKWFNPKTYQLIHPGLDGKFGAWQPTRRNTTTEVLYGSTHIGGGGRTAVLGGNYAGAGVGQFDLDNIVNFGDGATIQSMLP